MCSTEIMSSLPAFSSAPPVTPLQPTVALNTPIPVAVSLARVSRRSTLFVVEPGKHGGMQLRGEVSLVGLIRELMRNGDGMNVGLRGLVRPIEPVISRTQLQDITQLLDLFQAHQLIHLPVIDEQSGECIGILEQDRLLEWVMQPPHDELWGLKSDPTVSPPGDREAWPTPAPAPAPVPAREAAPPITVPTPSIAASSPIDTAPPSPPHPDPPQDSHTDDPATIQRLQADIADYRLLEGKLYSSYMQMQVLFDVMRDVTVIVAVTQDGFDVNIPSVTLFDDPVRSAVVEQAIAAFLDESQPNAFQDSVRHALQGDQTIECEHQFDVEDQTLHFEALISPISGTNVLWMARDITVQKRDRLKLQEYAQRLEQSEIRVRYLLTSNPAVVYTCKADNHAWKTFVGDNIRDLLGYDATCWLDDPTFWQVRLHPDDTGHVVTSLETLRDQGHCVMEYRFLHSNGVYRWLRDEIKLAIDTASGQPFEGIGSLVDITDRKRAENEVIKALEKERELNDLKSRFVSMASHEFRTPLAIIQSSAQLLERYELEPTEKQEQFHQINTSIVHMNQLLKDVLTLGKAEAGTLEFNPEPLRIWAFCNTLVPQLQIALGQTHRIAMMMDSQIDDTTIVTLDAKLLRQMLTNLLSNAIKYSPSADIVELNISLPSSKHICFRVTDSGIGIPTSDLPRLCESFHRAANVGTIQGTGLGLAIVHRCVSLHGGTIDFNSHVECGTTVTILLPQALQSPPVSFGLS
ncbi:MAG: PAS domain S-box protein [Oscillatoriales cyanobacterium]|nr:MAG: PAS domain S-box protein [Oscillatoriales cyanobacterium]